MTNEITKLVASGQKCDIWLLGEAFVKPCWVFLVLLLTGCATAPPVPPKIGEIDQQPQVETDVVLKVLPETPATYERTTLVIMSVTPNKVAFDGLQEITDETRGIRAWIYAGTSLSLASLFGPKNGLTDHMTVRATVRLSHPRGEKIIRKTILLRNVPSEIWLKAETQGVVQVIVQLDVPTRPEQQSRDEKDQAIAAAQQELLAALAGTEYVVIRQFKFTPGLVLAVGPAALAVLDRLSLVLNVTEERLLRPGLKQGVPGERP